MHNPSGGDPDAPSPLQDPVPPSRSQTMRESPLDPAQARRARRHSVEIRSNNRLSGFLNNLIHRRDPTPHSAREGPPRTPLNPSRSPSPPAKPVTPPQLFHPHACQELGLSLTEVTGDIRPPHFTNPPASGAFLAPHYLLLCHSQGLDVLPIVSPPAPQPYALIRRVNFKSVVVMEHRGVMVAIAGRREGVRVYALEEVKKAVEWRMDIEVRRERERQRRESKKAVITNPELALAKASGGKSRRASISVPPRPASNTRAPIPRKASTPLPLDQTAILPLMPRPPIPRSLTRGPRTPQALQVHPFGQPPPYSSAESALQGPPGSDSAIVAHARTFVNNMITSSPARPSTSSGSYVIKTNWEDASDDEAINVVAAGASGSQALDERTSAINATNTNPMDPNLPSVISHSLPAPSIRRNRPSNLDLPLALPLSSTSVGNERTADGDNGPDLNPTPAEGYEIDDEDEGNGGQVSLAQILLESRLPNLPPVGTRRPQQPILISTSHPVVSGDDEPSSPRASEAHTNSESHQSLLSRSQRSRRRRWSALINGNFGTEGASGSALNPSPSAPPREARIGRVASSRPSTAPPEEPPPLTSLPVDGGYSAHTPRSSRSTHFLSRFLSSAFHTKRSEDHLNFDFNEMDNSKKASAQLAINHPPPKLEFVKLPGTKGALLVKAVETPKKSFLAILCGEHGEKVELFAGTYRSALGLSRTFILPDSPKSLELQLQGDDLVEVFLVFAQNVFGLEPATVRVREVRIGRAERRAARRRARELRATTGAANTADPEEEVNVNVNVSLAVGTTAGRDPTFIPAEHPEAPPDQRPPSPEPGPSTSQGPADEILAVSTTQMGPYTTFQQLGFSPNFPLASVADDYIIPPTYPEFIDYRDLYEPESSVDAGRNTETTTQAQFSPPGLPVPPPIPPCKWYYRDPKGVVHGPWKASLMQTWYKDGLLPLDLPIRPEGETTFTLLRDLRLQSVDPTEPFRPNPLPVTSLAHSVSQHNNEKPLLSPISLLAQPRHFGPPALFYSSRGGHSTAIVDARGRSVLKGRLIWSNDDVSEEHASRMGDIKRLEAFNVSDRSVLVAMRQGGLEAVDLRDALLRPADESRTTLPTFNPGICTTSRRAPFVWKIGTPLSPSLVYTCPPEPSKKPTAGPVKTPGGKSESLGDPGADYQEEVVFLGRKDDELYLCERNATSFRILRLCTRPS